ncbi:TPA: hypothetical protein QCR38_005082 [Bacillus cereus]|nr:hypothetical protein [Bacillus cereus]
MNVKGQWIYLYRAVNSKGNNRSIFSKQNKRLEGCKALFKKALQPFHVFKVLCESSRQKPRLGF